MQASIYIVYHNEIGEDKYNIISLALSVIVEHIVQNYYIYHKVGLAYIDKYYSEVCKMCVLLYESYVIAKYYIFLSIVNC